MSETWVLNETISGILPQYNINFVSNKISFVAIIKSSNYLKYYIDENGNSSAMAYRNGSWTISAYRTITFETSPTGTLLTWLQANGTKQATEPTFSFTHRYKSDNLIGAGAYKFRPYTLTQQPTPDKPTDDPLAGTWTFNERLDLPPDSLPETFFEFPFYTEDGTEYSGLRIEYLDEVTGEYTGMLYDDIQVYGLVEGTPVWENEINRTITTNALLDELPNGQELLAFLQMNATKKGEGGATLISFTIDGTSYQAEEGMTWAQWVESSYNTGGFYIRDLTIYVYFPNGSYVSTEGFSGDMVDKSETIITNGTYYTYSSGGGN